MSISPKGRLAILISFALHGVGIGLCCWLASANQVKVTQSDLPHFVHASEGPSITAFVMGERTEVMDLTPQPKPIAPGKVEGPTKPAPPTTPSGLPAAIKVGALPAIEPNAGPGNPSVGNTISGAATTFFDVPVKAQKIVYLIDHSASMGPSGAREVAGQELLASLKRLPAGTRFQIIVYNRSANLLMPRYPDWLQANADAIRQVAAAWNELPAEGGTDHARALKLGLSQQPDVVFFLTDAGDVRADQLRDITRLNRAGIAIHVIELNAGQGQHDDGPLQLLAHENGGTFQPVLIR
jgi:hypothetical protein